MDIRRIRDPLAALGIAMHFLAQRAPFATFKAADLLATVDGQIRREHYLLAFEGQRVVGYIGWALFDEATARRLAVTMEVPSNDLARQYAETGDTIWLLTAASTAPAALRRLATAGRKLYPQKPVFGVRHDGKGGCSIRRVDIGRKAAGLRA